MSNPENNRNRRSNRPADPFGGPSNRGNTISLGFVLAALAFFLLLQWTNGDLGGLLQGSPTQALVAATSDATPTIEAADDAEDETAAPTATKVSQATATDRPTTAPTATSAAQARGVQTPRATVLPTPAANAPPAARASNLPTVAYDDLPPEAHDTIALIEQDGPFPYSRDGITFQNRERILPRQPEGYYREYTVITPGSRDRGARRIVTGEAGEMYYTDDHYDSFREIVR